MKKSSIMHIIILITLALFTCKQAEKGQTVSQQVVEVEQKESSDEIVKSSIYDRENKKEGLESEKANITDTKDGPDTTKESEDSDQITEGSKTDASLSDEVADPIEEHTETDEPTSEKEENDVDETVSVDTVSDNKESDEVKPELPISEEEAHDKITHEAFDQLLKKYVSADGKVNYKAFKKEKHLLKYYLDDLATHVPGSLSKRNERLAYWINVYNAFTIKLILDNYPLNSITELDGGKPWDKKWINLGGKNYSLNNIENDIIRPIFKEPRIHFAVNCAAKSCPPLLNEAWTAKNLERNFEKQTRKFINDPAHNKISVNSISLSKIFEWYKEDFPNLIGFVNNYSEVKVSSGASVSYQEYDWGLNE